jgi:hypothetical protein
MFMMIYVSSDTQVGRRAALRSSWMFWLQKNWLVTAPQTVVANTWERVQNTRAHRAWQAGTSDSRGFGYTCRLTVVSSVGRQERRLSILHLEFGQFGMPQAQAFQPASPTIGRCAPSASGTPPNHRWVANLAEWGTGSMPPEALGRRPVSPAGL